MRRAVLMLLFAVPLVAQLPAGTSRLTLRDDIRDAWYLTATGDVLWVASLFDSALDRVELGGASTSRRMPSLWMYTTGMASGPDGALWLGAPGWIARVDPATNELERWPLGTGVAAYSILSGPDGNVWFFQQGRIVVRMRPDGVFLSSYDPGANPTGVAFGSDGALYLAFPGKLMRLTAAGERTELPVSTRRLLFAGADFLWNTDPRTAAEAVQTPVGEIVKMSYRGEALESYRIDMSPIASDPQGNLWLRAKTVEGDIVGQLTHSGVLTRYGPFPSPVSTECHPRSFGGLAFLSDGRVAMTDYYREIADTLLSPCLRVPRPEGAKNIITILDPRVAPVLSVETLGRSKRRAARQ